MAKISEIRWHARGGQGTMLAARMLARIAIAEGKYAQGMPEFGPERMGAPVRAYNRISNDNFSLYCAVVNPDAVVVLDPSLLDSVNVTEGLNKNGIIIVNTILSPSQIRDKLKLTDGKVCTVDATGISIATLGRAIPNTPMMGAIVKTTGIVTLDGVLKDIKHTFTEKFSPKVIEGNLNAIKRGYEEVK
ncbi:MAG: 2-oxoacid:acceptor oxidoreductase family protein [Planctomycetota bacterium]|nr:2-oxoacid:acceptor oxidoreductase family protein [Planctomycetota bacterium]MDI6788210.1 2-oxoacid:acceptor oxidoreductase family protein [Planctomycetota bacterium]